MIETEVKIRINDPEETKRKLLALGCVISRERFLERNTLYDFRESVLFRKKEALRFRTIGKRSWLTFKGSPLKARSFKVREEFESEIKNPASLRKILKRLGLRPAFQYQKHRTTLKKGRLKICLDETAVGNYIELEGKRNDITTFARSLGFVRKDFLTRDYVEMIRSMKQEKRKN